MEQYTYCDLSQDKILISKLVMKKKYKEASKFLTDISFVASKHLLQQIYGMLFIIDLHIKDRK